MVLGISNMHTIVYMRVRISTCSWPT